MDNYNILIATAHGINTQFVSTNIDLIDHYKTAIIAGKGFIMWEDGVIDYTKIVGVTRISAVKPVEHAKK